MDVDGAQARDEYSRFATRDFDVNAHSKFRCRFDEGQCLSSKGQAGALHTIQCNALPTTILRASR